MEVDLREIVEMLEIKVFLEWAWKVLWVQEDHLGLSVQRALGNKGHKVKEELLESKVYPVLPSLSKVYIKYSRIVENNLFNHEFNHYRKTWRSRWSGSYWSTWLLPVL